MDVYIAYIIVAGAVTAVLVAAGLFCWWALST